MPRKTNTPTVAAALVLYMESRGDLARNTAVNDRSILGQFVAAVGKDRKGKDRQLVYLTPMQVERFFVEVIGPRNPSAASYNKCRQRVRSFLAYTSRHGWTPSPERPLADVRKRATVKIEKPTLAPDELVAILDAVTDPRDGTVRFSV